MNPKQRRGVLLIVLSVVGAVAVFSVVLTWVDDVRAQVGPMTAVVRLSQDVEPFVPVTADRLEMAEVPQRWAPGQALADPTAALGLVAEAPLPAGTVVQEGMLVAPPDLAPEQREIAILVDAETGVAGKVRPGDVVDIYATFEGTEDEPPRSEIVVNAAQVVDVGTPTEQRTGGPDAFDESQVVPVTFSLDVYDSLVLTYAESFATRVRLGRIAPGGDADVPEAERRFLLETLNARAGATEAPPAAEDEGR